MSSSAEPASGSSVAWRGLTAILGDKHFDCCAAVELDGNQLCSMKRGNGDVLHVAFREGQGSWTRHRTVSCCAPATERSDLSFPGNTRSKRWKKVKLLHHQVVFCKAERTHVSEYYVYPMWENVERMWLFPHEQSLFQETEDPYWLQHLCFLVFMFEGRIRWGKWPGGAVPSSDNLLLRTCGSALG